MCKDTSWIDYTPIKFEQNNIENLFVKLINDRLYTDFKVADFCICDDYIQIWNRENADSFTCKDGEYYVLYCFKFCINNKQVIEADLHELFSNFGY